MRDPARRTRTGSTRNTARDIRKVKQGKQRRAFDTLQYAQIDTNRLLGWILTQIENLGNLRQLRLVSQSNEASPNATVSDLR